MHNNIPNKNDLEKDLTSNLNNALEDEQEKIKFFYDWLKEQRDSVVIPYPDVGQYDVGIDRLDRISILEKKRQMISLEKNMINLTHIINVIIFLLGIAYMVDSIIILWKIPILNHVLMKTQKTHNGSMSMIMRMMILETVGYFLIGMQMLHCLVI